jgi:transcription antitermination protein NusB
MLSRRSIRIKVIQLLYSVSRDETIGRDEVLKRYWKSIDTSYELFLYTLYTLREISKVAVEDKEQRSTKYIQSEVDKAFEPKLYNSIQIQDLIKNKSVQKIFEKYHFKERSDSDIFKNIYFEFSKEEIYQAYILKETTSEDDLEMLLELFRFCRNNAIYNEIIEDQFFTWHDDKSLVIGTIKKVLKSLPIGKKDLAAEYYPEEIHTKEFGELLLTKTYEDDTILLDTISPLLKNWRTDRVAIIDMIMIKMALTEFLYCESVNVKVTLNEYVELSKAYSTSKSKVFINGVIDALLKKLESEDKIHKSGRGLNEGTED